MDLIEDIPSLECLGNIQGANERRYVRAGSFDLRPTKIFGAFFSCQGKRTVLRSLRHFRSATYLSSKCLGESTSKVFITSDTTYAPTPCWESAIKSKEFESLCGGVPEIPALRRSRKITIQNHPELHSKTLAIIQ